MEKSEVGKSADGFIDRSKVRILLCDNDEKSSEEVFTLLCRCSYQVTTVKSPRQVIDALNAEGPDIDIILSEVDLPMSKGLKMLKYITRDVGLRRIPVIMMSAQDDVPVVVKCLKLGAADYLVKPLRTNELLNLWTHMWRRRRLLGLVEKNIISYDFDMVASDHSDGKTNSTTIFSDDTDEKSRKNSNPKPGVSTYQEDDINTPRFAAVATTVEVAPECPPDVPGISDRRTGQISSVPKKSELKIGESSAFFTYIKSVTSKSDEHGASVHESTPQSMNIVENMVTRNYNGLSKQIPEVGNTLSSGNHPSSNSVPESFSLERSNTPPCSLDISQQRNPGDFPQEQHLHIRNDPPNDAAGFMHGAYPYYFPGMMNHYSISPYVQNHPNSAMLPHYPHIPQCPSQMPAYTYYPFGVCLQPGQPSLQHPGPAVEIPNSNKGQVKKIDRREAALIKFRQKRKERCFDKKIRYVNRKKLAERRPRLRGQFVRKEDGVNVDLCDQPASVEDEEESDDEDPADFSPDDDTSMCHS